MTTPIFRSHFKVTTSERTSFFTNLNLHNYPINQSEMIPLVCLFTDNFPYHPSSWDSPEQGSCLFIHSCMLWTKNSVWDVEENDKIQEVMWIHCFCSFRVTAGYKALVLSAAIDFLVVVNCSQQCEGQVFCLKSHGSQVQYSWLWLKRRRSFILSSLQSYYGFILFLMLLFLFISDLEWFPEYKWIIPDNS
jgi:hypothetical protein